MVNTVEVAETPTASSLEPLIVADRCDHKDCPAQALVRLSKSTMVLDLCGHHFHELEPSLLGQGFEIQQDVRDTMKVVISSCSTSS